MIPQCRLPEDGFFFVINIILLAFREAVYEKCSTTMAMQDAIAKIGIYQAMLGKPKF